MVFSLGQKGALQAIFAVTIAFTAGSLAVAFAYRPGYAPPPLSPSELGPPPGYTGARYSLATYLDVPPPAGCRDLIYATDEASLRSYLGQVPDYASGYWGYPVMNDAWGRPSGAEALPGGAPSASGTPSFSGTNNQVPGADEIDMVKTDGWYIYTATGGKVQILRSYPAEALRVVSTIELGGYAYGLFVAGDRLIVVLQPTYVYDGPQPLAGVSIWPGPSYYSSDVEMRVYDMTDRAAPRVLYNYSVSGYFNGARMIGDFVYLISNFNIYQISGALKLPSISENGVPRAVAPREVGLLEAASNTTFLTTILSVNVTGAGALKTSSYLTPSGGVVYVSLRNIYLLGQTYEWTADWRLLSTETVVSKFSFYKGEVLCYFTARVPGTVLNQFSADEAYTDGRPFLRLATTVRATEWTNVSAAVFVLNETLARVGAVEGIAQGETVQASRFVGERGYLVTFRRVDPLFVLNLSDPTDPQVVGEVTLPGFSQYLQPIDATHLIGIGVEATDDGRVTGLGISLFDVSDPAHPAVVDRYTPGDYSYSEAQYDHKAVLYIPASGLLVIPVQMYDYTAEMRGGGQSFQGAYVLGVDAETGFTLKATIAHPSSVAGKDYYGAPITYQPTIRRSLFIGEFLYTVSELYIQANTMTDFTVVSSATIGTPPDYSYSYGGGTVGVAPPPGGAGTL